MDITPSIFNALDSINIAVIGDFCLDVYWHADMQKSELSRETPHFPLPIVQERLSPGGAGNVLANILALKPKTAYALGVFGNDWRGDALTKLLKDMGATTSHIVFDSTRQTNAYIKPLKQGISDVVYEDPRLDFTNYTQLSTETEQQLIKNLLDIAPTLDVLCVSDQMPYGCITPAVRDTIIDLGKNGLQIVVDSRDRIALYHDVIVKPNHIEAARALDEPISENIEDLVKYVEKLANQTKRTAIVTAAENGCVIAEPFTAATHVPAVTVIGEIDFCGAGDTFQSMFACALAAKLPHPLCAKLACNASAVTIKKLKTTGTASREEVLAVLANQD